MKRIIRFCLIVVLVLVLAGCGAKGSKKDIFNFVENNYDVIVAACEKKDSEGLLAIDGIKEVNIVDGYVVVSCIATGIVPSSQYYGFYYSEDNLPVGVDCNQHIVCDTDDLTAKGDGYQYIDYGNVFYTERIKDNIYFYSASY